LKLSEDLTWDNIESAGWSVGELCSGLTCACLPTFRPLLGKWFPGLSTRVHATGKYCPQSSTDYSRDPEKGILSRPVWSRRATGMSQTRPAWSRHASGLHRGESQDNLHANAATHGGFKKSGSEDVAFPRPAVLKDQGEMASDESMHMPIMQPEPLGTVETRIGAGSGRNSSLGSAAAIRVKTDIRRTESQRR
jgi:hypothetical protein